MSVDKAQSHRSRKLAADRLLRLREDLRQRIFQGQFARLTFISIIVGTGSGIAAIVFILAIRFVTTIFLGWIAGYTPPLPGGEGSSSFMLGDRFYLVPLATALGGLAGGLIVYLLAPEAEGVGTDAAIRAFHHETAKIRPRVPIVKLVTSALTIGSGGTSGREGPIAQIGAGLGSLVSDLTGSDKRTREIMVAAGLGSGIAAIFKAPLAGAIIGAEIFYTRDFEVEALIPGFVASVVGYSIVGFATGWQPIFAANVNPTEFRNPFSLPLYAILGVACALLTIILFHVYFPVTKLFKKWSAPLYLRTCLGGLATGLIALAFPSVLGTGYGWVQIALDQKYLVFPVLVILGAALAEILSLSFTLGSGGSGGIFGPSVVVGGLLGAVLGFWFNQLFPSLVPNPSDFAVVGMMAFFAADGKAPLSTIILVAEMTGGYGLLAPSMFAVTTAFLLSGSKSVFPSQLPTRRSSPAHREEYEALVLADTPVSDVMTRAVTMIEEHETVQRAMALMYQYGIGGLPVVNQSSELVGIVTKSDASRVAPPNASTTDVSQIMTRRVCSCQPDDDLYRVLKIMTLHEIGRIPVVRSGKPLLVIGIITRSDIGKVLESIQPVQS